MMNIPGGSSTSTPGFEQSRRLTTCEAAGYLQLQQELGILADDQDDNLLFSSSTTTTETRNNRDSYTMSGTTTATTLLNHLSILREKVLQLQSLIVAITISPPPPPHHQAYHEMVSSDADAAGSVIQEIIAAASSMAYTFQQIASPGMPPQAAVNELDLQLQHHYARVKLVPYVDHDQLLTNNSNTGRDQLLTLQRNPSEEAGKERISVTKQFAGSIVLAAIHTPAGPSKKLHTQKGKKTGSGMQVQKNNVDDDGDHDCVIELDAADLLAKYTHFCQVCGKGFKRDANLRMHMRAHGDEYKSNAALANPLKKKMKMMYLSKNDTSTDNIDQEEEDDRFASEQPQSGPLIKYSCPQEGCRWNKKHAKFQPLKSMICVKNHYKRSHCPKMYVCNRCNSKHFSVLSDLRTHEKHCGDHLRWRCSCGTTFSRKDKLMGHTALFVGHTPASSPPPTTM